MSSENNNPGNNPNQPKPNSEGTFSMEYRHSPVSARVPEKVARGVLSTGVLVLDGPNEFVLDFMQGLARPFQVGARVVVSPAVMEQLVAAVRDNLNKYEQRFGPPPQLPKPPTDRRPTLQEIYDEFKLPEDMLSGVYSNAVMVGHSPSEFFFDFITNFFPTSAVACRVYMSAAQLPRMLDAVTMAFGRYQQRLNAMRGQQGQMQVPPPIQHPSLQNPPPPPLKPTDDIPPANG